LSQLKYNGNIRSYFTEFWALNNYAHATGEVLQEKVDRAMTSEILRMRFSDYLGEFADDEGYLDATYQVGLQVERMKALEKAREGRQGRIEEKRRKHRERRPMPQKGKKHENITARIVPTTRHQGNQTGLGKKIPGVWRTKQ